MNMGEKERLASQQLAQGPDAGVARSSLALTGLATKADDAMDGPYVFPGLFLVGNGSQVEGEFGMPAASMSSGVGGMGVHWSGSCPRPSGPERISFIDAATLDEAYATAESLLAVSKDLHVGDELLANVRDVVASEFEHDAEPIGFMPGAMTRDGNGFRTSGTSAILGDVAERVSRFELRTETIARRIILDDGAAVGAQLEDRRTGDSYEVNARRVVVCADSLRTPQVLLRVRDSPTGAGALPQRTLPNLHVGETAQRLCQRAPRSGRARSNGICADSSRQRRPSDAGTSRSPVENGAQIPVRRCINCHERPSNLSVVRSEGYPIQRLRPVQRDGDRLLRHAGHDDPLHAH